MGQVQGAPRHQHAPGWSAVQDKVVKQAAKQAYQAAVEDVERTANQRKEGKASAADRTAGLRPKLQRAIEAMQSGLVERDTEVRGAGLRERSDVWNLLPSRSADPAVARCCGHALRAGGA